MAERMVSIDKLEEGMRIIADVHNRGGVIVVPAYTVVNYEVIDLLARHSIKEVLIDKETENAEVSLEDINILGNALDMLTYMEERENKQSAFEIAFRVAVEDVKVFFEQVLTHQDVDIYQLLDIVATVVESADNNVNLFQMLYKMMNREVEDIYEHCILVSLYAQLLAKWADLTADEVELAGLAGALHDIGLIVCHNDGEKNISLHGEYNNQCGFNHMLHSYNLIKDIDVDARLKQAILTHHERMDLSGFPNKLSYKQLNSVSRVVAIADGFATLTMKEEGFEALLPLNALCNMYETGYIKFDTKLLICFSEHVVQNFMQYEAVLSDGRRGKIVMPGKREPARPWVMIGNEMLDLSKRKDLSIVEMYY